MYPLAHPKMKIKGIKKSQSQSQVSRSILSSMFWNVPLLYFRGKSAFICFTSFIAVEFMALNLIPEAEVESEESCADVPGRFGNCRSVMRLPLAKKKKKNPNRLGKWVQINLVIKSWFYRLFCKILPNACKISGYLYPLKLWIIWYISILTARHSTQFQQVHAQLLFTRQNPFSNH